MAKSAFGTAFAIGLAMASSVGAATDSGLVTGSAVYKLSLEDGGGAMDDVTGSMTTTLTRDCDVYRTEMSLSADFEGPPGAIPMAIDAVALEGATTLDFDMTGKLASMEIERAKGTATTAADGVTVVLEEPEAKTRTIDAKAIFPLAMIRQSIEAAKAGESLAEFTLYDGSGHGRDVWLVSVAIGAPAESTHDSDEDAPFAAGLGFSDMAKWQMVFSYFPRGASGDLTPSFASKAIVYENGFAQAASYDFGEFAMHLTLEEFSPIPPVPCPPSDQNPQK
jgi:uncharacterized protein YuzE